MPESLKRNSKKLTEGPDRAPARAMLRAVGLVDEDFNKPLIAVANTEGLQGGDQRRRAGIHGYRPVDAQILGELVFKPVDLGTTGQPAARNWPHSTNGRPAKES